jgi:hypothetical protein
VRASKSVVVQEAAAVPEIPGRAAAAPTDAPWIRLYVRAGDQPAQVVPSPVARGWYQPWMYHCLPLAAAGQLGWTVLNPVAFAAVWDGTIDQAGVRVSSQGHQVSSHFGHGTVTISPGFYVRTSPEVDLLVRGVPNLPKDGATMLEGLIETDWFDGSFTVNVRLTRPGLVVGWDRDEPLFQLVPYPRGWLERFRPEIVTAGPDHAAFFETADRWEHDRLTMMAARRRGEEIGFDGQYRRGRRHDGVPAPDTHRRSLRVPPFELRSD